MKTSELPKIFPYVVYKPVYAIGINVCDIIRYPCYIRGISMFKLALGGMMDSKINLVKNCEIE